LYFQQLQFEERVENSKALFTLPDVDKKVSKRLGV